MNSECATVGETDCKDLRFGYRSICVSRGFGWSVRGDVLEKVTAIRENCRLISASPSEGDILLSNNLPHRSFLNPSYVC